MTSPSDSLPEETQAHQEAFVKSIADMAETSMKTLQQINTLAKLVVDLSKRVQILEGKMNVIFVERNHDL